ncbi:DUF616 domain-containing protein [Rhodoblastus sp. 17X3]|uniref:glycosyltransferase domain-containing protein n=1 Tax=Rhodoblastus sp. 17X3 TaxID=3047026 RepID=UPI0024B83A5F|nr:glycosyltransferase domain-containing protein [Rhodoblastus sp. 17X3]MDI9849972.1 DUF616 domain-containing protein [Rhodoblastus sp. 17X3]
MPSRCVYTVLTGGYELLNEQAVAKESSLPFICLTDDPNLMSDSWKIQQIEPTFATDPIRSQRDLKIRPHVHLPEFDQSLYIDNSVILKVRPETLFATFLNDTPMAIPTHSYRENLLDEFLEVTRYGFDDPNRLFEQINHYALFDPTLLEERPYWTAILLRDHADSSVRKMLEIWAAHVFRYSRRDQLSANLAFRNAGLTPHAIEIDNFESWFHSWPVTIGRERTKGMRDIATSLSPVVYRLRKAERELAEKESARESLARALEERLAFERTGNSEIPAADAASSREPGVFPGELDAARNELGQMRGELDAARRELGQMRGELDEARRALGQMCTEPDAVRTEFGLMRGELDEARRELGLIRGELDGARRALGQVRGEEEAAGGSIEREP